MENIFYYRHSNNEIYEMKFNKVIVGLNGRERDVKNNKFNVLYVEVEVAGLGTMTWAKYGYKNTLSVVNIYDTIEKAIRGNNINTLNYDKIRKGVRAEDFFKVVWDNAWDCSFFDVDFIIPNHIFENVQNNLFGQRTIYYHTWVWDGFNAVEKGCIGVEKLKNGVPNTNKELLYDLINKECIYNKEIIGYPTREECVRANSVKIHRF